MRRRAGAALLAVLVASGCVRQRPPPVLHPAQHYVLGAPYDAGGHWFYPAESYDLDSTGIAGVQAAASGLTADGELADPGLLTAAMQTIQLPAIARVTNLENGRQITLRVNDRGPADPARLIALSPRAALLLGMAPGGVALVRVTLDPVLSRRVVEQVGGGPSLAVRTAPRAAVQEQDLPPPGAGRAAGAVHTVGAAAEAAPAPPVPERLPEQVRLVGTAPGELYLDAGSFGRFEYANMRAAALSGLGADVVRSTEGRSPKFTVRAGPFRSIAAADAAMAFALRAGIRDARLVIE